MSRDELNNPSKPMAVSLFTKFVRETPELTFGETLYSILRSTNFSNLPNEVKIGWLRNISDDDFCASIERALINDTKEDSDDRESDKKQV